MASPSFDAGVDRAKTRGASGEVIEMDATQANALVGRLLEGFNSGDMDRIESCFHAEARAEFPFAPPPMPTAVSGRDAVMAMFRDGRANFRRMTLTPSRFYWCPDDSTLVMEAQSDAVLAGGASYRNSYVFLIGIRDERVILWREYFNSLVVAEAMSAS